MKTRLILNRWDEYGRSVAIKAQYLDGTEHELASVMQSTSLDDGSPQPATVNWPSIGSVPPAVALAAVAAIEEAARVAGEMEKVEEWGRITPPKPGLRWGGGGMPQLHLKDGRAWVDSDGWIQEQEEGTNAEG